MCIGLILLNFPINVLCLVSRFKSFEMLILEKIFLKFLPEQIFYPIFILNTKDLIWN